MENRFEPPQDVFEWIFNGWPASIGYGLLFGVGLIGVLSGRHRPRIPWWLIALPAFWLLWQLLSAFRSSDPTLSRMTFQHFVICVACFYLGLFVLGKDGNPRAFWVGVAVGFGLMLTSGFMQRFGGLEATRKYFWLYIYPKETGSVEPELIKRMTSDRIFATLFYPNTLAGAILLWLPMILGGVWTWKNQFTAAARRFLMAVLALAAVLCLIWSGSKAGWLILLVEGFVGVLFLPIARRVKLILVAVVLMVGLAGFFAKYAGFFQRGATSVVARFDYWEAAFKIAERNPGYGTGPGTFAREYRRIKRPESEMARIAHNDYLQQACDSGFIGFLAFSGFMVGALIFTNRRSQLGRSRKLSEASEDETGWLRLAVWLGLLGISLQSFVEFGLYIPAIAWSWFTLLGWLLAQSGKAIDTTSRVG